MTHTPQEPPRKRAEQLVDPIFDDYPPHGWRETTIELVQSLIEAEAAAHTHSPCQHRETLEVGLRFAKMSRGGSGAGFLDRFNATRREFERLSGEAVLSEECRPDIDVCPDCEMSATAIGQIHINAQRARLTSSEKVR